MSPPVGHTIGAQLWVERRLTESSIIAFDVMDAGLHSDESSRRLD
jgi:hypothetical protein